MAYIPFVKNVEAQKIWSKLYPPKCGYSYIERSDYYSSRKNGMRKMRPSQVRDRLFQNP